MKGFSMAIAGLSIIMATAASAATPTQTSGTASAPAPAPAKSNAPVKPLTMTCSDFLSYDMVTRPQIVYWSEAVNQKGKPQDAVIDVDRINSLVPVLVEECRREPQSSFWQRVKNDFKHAF